MKGEKVRGAIETGVCQRMRVDELPSWISPAPFSKTNKANQVRRNVQLLIEPMRGEKKNKKKAIVE